MSNDPWAAAQANTTGNAAPTTSVAEQAAESGQQGSSLMPESAGLGGASLFGGGGKKIPSLFNASHPKDTIRTGVSTDIKDVHSRELIRNDDGSYSQGELRFWEDGNSGKGTRPVTYPISKITGKQNRPVMDVHIILTTEYRMQEAERAVVKYSKEFLAEDDGDRKFIVNDIKAVQKAVEEYNQANPATRITGPEGLLNKRWTFKRLAEPREKQSFLIKIDNV